MSEVQKEQEQAEVPEEATDEDSSEFMPSSSDFELARGKVQKRQESVPCPELNEVFGAPEGKNVTFLVEQCNLSTYLRLQGERQGVSQVLVSGLLKALRAGNEEEVGRMLAKHFFGGDGKELSPQAKFELELCQSCVLEPKISRSDWLWLSDMFPMSVNKLANKIVDLTLRGGIKKN